MGYLFKPSRFLPGSCRHQHPRYPPHPQLPKWMGQSRSMQFSTGKSLETTCEYPSVWRLEENPQKCPAASLELNSEDFSPAFVCFFQEEGLCSKFTTERKTQRWSGSSHTYSLAMDCMYLFICFSLSQVFLDHIVAAETHGELVFFFYMLGFCFMNKCTLTSRSKGIKIKKGWTILLIGHNESDSFSF